MMGPGGVRRVREGRPGTTAVARGGGFTLLELIVVLAIIAAATALVLPSVGRGTEGLRLRSEAGRVAALLREARLAAVSQRHPTRVVLDRVRNTVVLTGRDPEHPMRELALSPGLRLSIGTGGETLTFSSRGLTRQTRWLLEAPGGRRLAIDIDAVTGRVSVGPETRS
ncbi:MAG: prepilin-type N-terminal cleavage/methylation domain-containing protein [Candidatus Rokubacteria bacterium]|nr:prepilin-type N-terminal cleavage/methylation domain-containing protein [Candidatus Rokubacteria bacterium]